MYRALGQWCYANWGKVVLAWVALVIGVGAVAGTVGSAFSATFEIPESESRDGFDALDEHFGGFGSGQPGSIVFRAEQGVDDPEVMAVMNELFEFTVALDPDQIQLASPYEPSPQPLVSQAGPEAGLIAYADLTLDQSVDQVVAAEWGVEIRDHAEELVAEAGLEGELQIETGGQVLSEFEPPETELIGLAFAVIVLILAFGSVMAMGLPIGVAVAGVATGIGIINLLSNAISIPDFAIQLGAMIGLGVGIDYALFIVTRYRNSLAAGHDQYAAVGIALDTAGRAVVFAGLTVVVSLLGMLLIGLPFISGLGIGAASTVTITMIASITLLPALLGLVKDRVEISRVRGLVAAGLASIGLFLIGIGVAPLSGFLFLGAGIAIALLVGTFVPPMRRIIPPRPEKPIRETLAYRWSRVIQAHPWLAMAVGTSILLVLAAPVLGLRLGFSDEGNFPEDTSTRKAYDLIADGFGDGYNGPLIITAELDGPEGGAQIPALQAAIESTDGVAAVAAVPSNVDEPAASEAFLLRVIPTTSPQDEATQDLVETLRDDVIPPVSDGLEVSVTGAVPANIDFTSFLSARILVFFGAVLTISFLLLMAVFRSVVVPIKAVVMNVLSIASAYGVVVAIFQWGWFGSFFGIAEAPIEPFIPMMLFAIVFGLSMDYEVFLLSRIKEEYEKTGDAQNSVADGLAATARVITAAAAIMVVVFGAFMLEDNRIIKLFGLGLAMAVFLDASLVRMLLVPATMELLGHRNWWLPRWLDRIIPNLNVEGTEPPPPAPVGEEPDDSRDDDAEPDASPPFRSEPVPT
ncbi:MAG: MMPL family transporter [Actinomycetota bacterium]